MCVMHNESLQSSNKYIEKDEAKFCVLREVKVSTCWTCDTLNL